MLTSGQIIEAIHKDRNSVRKRKARKGQEYYDARHDILDYRIFFINKDGKMQEDILRSNNRVPHPFFTEIADQEVGYLLSGGLELTSAVPELQELMAEYFNDSFVDELAEILTDAVVRGFGYVYWYKDSKGMTRFCHADSMNVVEVKDGNTSDAVNDYIIRYYPIAVKNNKRMDRVEVWDKNMTTYYLYDGLSLQKDNNISFNPRPHILYQVRGEYYYEDYNCLPFLRLDYNRRQKSQLFRIKGIIDDYDLMDCGLSNNLIDIQEGIYVVKGYKGTNMDELMANVKSRKVIGVGDKGDLDIKTVNIPYEARKTKMEEDEKNIYRFSQSFNSNQTGDGNITNVVIQSRYTLLDLKVGKLEIRVRDFLTRLIEVLMPEINARLGADYSASDVMIKFPKLLPTNQKEDADIDKIKAETNQIKINTATMAATVLDSETVLELICKILDLDGRNVMQRYQDNEVPKLGMIREALNEQVSETSGTADDPE